MHLGPLEIGLILLLVLVVFGAGKLPEVGSALGRSIREFNRAKTGDDEEKKEKGAPDSESPQVQLGRTFAEIKRTAADLKKGLDIENILKGDEVKQGKGALDLESHQQQSDFQKRGDVTEIKKMEKERKI